MADAGMISYAADTIMRRLREVVDGSPGLLEVAQFYEAILPVLHNADLHVLPVVISAEECRDKMGKGLPLLADLDISLDIDAAHDLMVRLAHTVEGKKLVKHESARRIRLALEAKSMDISELMPHVVSGNNDPIISLAKNLDLEPDLLVMLARNVFKPALRTCCRQLTPLAEGIEWHKGFCFICGAAASLGELQGNDQAIHLRCGQCGADWPFRRLLCLYCRNEDHDSLRLLYPDKEREKMHIEVCDECKGYLKVIAAFSPTPSEMLPIEDLATLHLDYIAQDRGYMRKSLR